MPQLFPNGYKGLSDSKWSGAPGSVFKSIGIDAHSKPGLIRIHQALAKHSGSTIDELCKVAVPVSDGSKLWFSSESGKVWRESGGTYTLIHTSDSDPDVLEDTFGYSFSADVEAWAIGMCVMPSGSAYPQLVYSKSGGSTGGSTTLSVSAVVPSGTNRVLIVVASNIEASADQASGVTFNSVAMTSVSAGASAIEGVDARYSIWRLVNPDATTANIEVTWAGSTTNRMLHAFVFTGAHQTTPVANVVNSVNNTDADSHTLNVPGTADYQTRLAYCMSEFATHTQAASQTVAESTVSGSTYSYTSAVVNDLNMGDNKNISAEEHGDYVFWTTERLLFRIAVEDIASAWSVPDSYGYFVNGDDTYHPMVKQNNELFIGDSIVLARVGDADDDEYLFTAETDFNIQAPERITTLSAYDVDILVGTIDVVRARVLRWDTVSPSWSAQDWIPEAGVKAFLRDDNYVYVLVGDFGKWYFYNGEKLEPFFRIPGDWSPTAKAVVNPHAVGFWNGLPLFGLSNSTGNPASQGVYSFGSYDKNYPKILDLAFPISSGEFSGMSIGAIIVDGLDLYVSWKGASTQGVDKLNWSAKYASAYIESMQVIPPTNRGFLKTLKEFRANYALLPTGTDITLKYDNNYSGTYTTLTSVKDTNLLQKRSNKSINKIGALQLKLEFTVSSNDAPEIEDAEYFFNNQQSKI